MGLLQDDMNQMEYGKKAEIANVSKDAQRKGIEQGKKLEQLKQLEIQRQRNEQAMLYKQRQQDANATRDLHRERLYNERLRQRAMSQADGNVSMMGADGYPTQELEQRSAAMNYDQGNQVGDGSGVVTPQGEAAAYIDELDKAKLAGATRDEFMALKNQMDSRISQSGMKLVQAEQQRRAQQPQGQAYTVDPTVVPQTQPSPADIASEQVMGEVFPPQQRQPALSPEQYQAMQQR